MKNTERLKKLLIIFAVLLAFLIVSLILSQRSKSSISAISNFKKEQVSKLKVTVDERNWEIYKKEKAWVTKSKEKDEFPADQEVVEAILDSLSKLTKDESISENKNKYSQFEVDGRRKIEVDTSEKESLTVFVGKQQSSEKAYFRFSGDPAVYIAPNDLSTVFENTDFRDLKPHLVGEEDKVKFVEIDWDEVNLKLIKKVDQWLTGSGKKAKRDRVDYLINDLKTLKGQGIEKKENIDLAVQTVELTLKVIEGDKEREGKFYKRADNSYYFLTSNSSYLIKIPGVYVDSLKKTEEDFTD